MSETALATRESRDTAQLIENVVIKGDLSALTASERTTYYQRVCESLGVNPLTRPFEYIILNNKTVLYARKDLTDQLRKNHGVSVSIVSRERIEDVYIVTARATLPNGRYDESTGVVAIAKEDGEWKTADSGKKYFAPNGKFTPMRGDDLANSLMKAETKSKRRVTLSIVGLGMLDESEIETIPGAQRVEAEETEPKPPAPKPALTSSRPTVASTPPNVPTLDASRTSQMIRHKKLIEALQKLNVPVSDFKDYLIESGDTTDTITAKGDSLRQIYSDAKVDAQVLADALEETSFVETTARVIPAQAEAFPEDGFREEEF